LLGQSAVGGTGCRPGAVEFLPGPASVSCQSRPREGDSTVLQKQFPARHERYSANGDPGERAPGEVVAAADTGAVAGSDPRWYRERHPVWRRPRAYTRSESCMCIRRGLRKTAATEG